MPIKSGWSTQDLADIAGTTLKTVRHYHALGLLEEPERGTNGYKKYGVPHLIRLLRIRRLVGLGVPLSRIAEVEESPQSAELALRAADEELAASIERRQRMRDDLAAVLKRPDLAELPPDFADVSDMSAEDRQFLLVCSRVFPDEVMDSLRALTARPRTPAEKEFATLPADATDQERQHLAERMAPEIHRDQQAHPAITTVGDPRRDPLAWAVAARGAVELYNAAQIDVLQRANKIIEASVRR